jgi:site-specific DNA-methyltransferase (adenine-specific)
LWPLLRGVCKPNAAMCFTAQQPFTTMLINSNPSEFQYDWVVEKARATGHLNSARRPLKAHETALVFYREQPTYNPQMGEGQPYSITEGKNAQTTNYGYTRAKPRVIRETSRHPRSVLRFGSYNNRHKDRPRHPTEKPVALLEYLIRTYTNPGDLVLDPTAGALTTAVAAHATGRRAVCVEMEREYVDLGIRRLVDAGADWIEAGT